jgi:hypothetical protein
LICLYHLQKLGRCANASQKEFETLTVDISENKLSKYPRFRNLKKKKHESPEVFFISDFLKRKTRDIDKRFYPVTFQQLKTILNGYGFSIESPHGNTIDIVKYEERRGYLGLGQKKTVTKKLGQIGFPGWKSQVGKGAINTTRKATGLTPEKGYDSQSFF